MFIHNFCSLVLSVASSAPKNQLKLILEYTECNPR